MGDDSRGVGFLPVRAVRWLIGEVLEKLNLVATWRNLKELGQKYGRRFFVAAVIWELVEDVVFPLLSWWAGYPWLGLLFIALHFEPVVYPIFFWCFRTWDRMRGLEPWSPDRNAESAFWRTGLVSLSHRLASVAVFWAYFSSCGINPWVFSVWMFGMTAFDFVHGRLWHDSNFGIDVPTDRVRPIRIVAKAVSYRAVSCLIMSGMFTGLFGSVPRTVWLYQLTMLGISLLIGAAWSRSTLGIRTLQAS